MMSSRHLPTRPLNPVNRGRVVQAVYREPETADYAGNPLIEALPPALTTEQAMIGLAYYPHYDEAQRFAPDHIRYHLIQNGLRFFAPLDIHLDLERRFSCLIRVGYTERNPLATGLRERSCGESRGLLSVWRNLSAEAPSMAVVGRGFQHRGYERRGQVFLRGTNPEPLPAGHPPQPLSGAKLHSLANHLGQARLSVRR